MVNRFFATGCGVTDYELQCMGESGRTEGHNLFAHSRPRQVSDKTSFLYEIKSRKTPKKFHIITFRFP